MGLGRLNFFIFLGAAFLSCLPCFAALMPMAMVPFVDSKPFNVMAWIKERDSLLSERRIDIDRFVTVSKFHRQMDEDEFSRNVMETTIKTLTESKLRSVSQVLNEVEEYTSADLRIGQGDETSQVKVKMDVVRAEAKLAYKGEVDAELKYQIGNAQLQMEISRSFGSTKVIAAHIEQNGERTDSLGLRWSF